MRERYRQFTVSETCQAITVEVIRRLWDGGRYRDNKWAQRVHENWFELWVDWRTQITMRNVDSQADKILEDWEQADAVAQAPRFTEALKGETALGGPMQLSHPTLGQLDDLKPTEDNTHEASSPEGTGQTSRTEAP